MHYATRSNGVKLVRTPGNRLVAQKRTKRAKGPHTPWVLGHKRLAGTKALRHIESRNASRYRKTVSRPYGGVLSADQVRDRVVRAFLIEEQRIVKKVLQAEAKYQKEKKRRDAKKKKRAERAKTSAVKKAAIGKAKPAGKASKPAKAAAKPAAKVAAKPAAKPAAKAAAAAKPAAKAAAAAKPAAKVAPKKK
jgi:large subunit ribosomal protein L34e